METQSSVAAPRRRAGKVWRVTLGALMVIAFATGCGQKGPLTLPPASSASAPAR